MAKMKQNKGQATQSRRNAAHRERARSIGRKSSAPSRSAGSWTRPVSGDVEAWLLTYLPGAFPLPFGQVHRDIMAAVMGAIRTAGNVAIAAPRGTGKSTLVNGLVLYALLEQLTPFPVVIPWDDRAKRRALRFWAGELCFNPRLHRDYTEATAAFKASRGQANRLASIHEGGESTGARLGITEGVIVLPHGLGAIGSATINGNPRGLNYASIDGRVVRPSLAVVDDPQDRDVAKSRVLVAETRERIDGDVSGMAGPDSRMPIVLTCTVIERDDVAEHYLSDHDWHAVRVGQVVTWPNGWERKDSETRRLWGEWNVMRQESEDGGKDALAFYAANRDAMTAGMTVSWAERYDRKRGQPDAMYAAMVDWHVMGEDAFAAERQNAPIKRGVTIYQLTPDVICSRATDRQAGAVPDWCRMRVAATDINPSYGLTWAVVGFGADQTAGVIGYGVHEMHVAAGATEAEAAQAIYEALAVHGRYLAALACRPETWVIDAGGSAFDVVLRFCIESSRLCNGLQAIPATGRGARNYRESGRSVLGKPREKCHMAVDTRGRKWIAWHADYWREQAQKAWTGSVGAPGSCSLPAGHHRDFAEQICREQLMGKAEVGGMMMWNWHTQPGRHDYGDCMAMAYMAAAWQGIGTQGTTQPTARPVARVFVSRPSNRRG